MPTLPTDNLYKFLALASLAACIACLYLSVNPQVLRPTQRLLDTKIQPMRAASKEKIDKKIDRQLAELQKERAAEKAEERRLREAVEDAEDNMIGASTGRERRAAERRVARSKADLDEFLSERDERQAQARLRNDRATEQAAQDKERLIRTGEELQRAADWMAKLLHDMKESERRGEWVFRGLIASAFAFLLISIAGFWLWYRRVCRHRHR